MNTIHRIWVNINRLPKVGKVISLMIIAGFTEGIGVSMLLPILTFVTGQSELSALPRPFDMIPVFLESVGLEISLLSMLAVTAVLISSAFLLSYLQERALYWSRFEWLRRVRYRAEKALLNASWRKLSQLSSGDVANRLSKEVLTATESLMAMAMFIAILVQTLIYVVLAFLLSVKMSCIAIGAITVAVFLGKRVIDKVKSLGKVSTAVNNRYGEQLVDFLRGMKLIKAIASEDKVISYLNKTNDLVCTTLYKICCSSSFLKFQIQGILSLFILTILYIALAILNLELSIVLVFMFIIMRFTPRISALQNQYHNYVAYMPSLQTIDELISQAEEEAEGLKPDLIPFEKFESVICFENIHFTYPDQEKPALFDVSFEIPANKMIGLVGGSGGGKSTVIDLLVGFYEPSVGSITIDGTPLHDISMKHWRKQIGYVTQESIMFNATIRENLTFAHDVPEEYLWECLELAQLAQVIRDLPDKLDAELGENGMRFSGGQKQRLSLARALVGRPQLLLLDEATSALDNESERLIQMAMDEVAGQYTIIVVAHRISTIRKADVIYVLEEGKIVESGTYDGLLKQNGRFSTLHALQFE
ncbi:ABC transporter ATP-binding protein [Thermodesulfobacteriota bacterium]